MQEGTWSEHRCLVTPLQSIHTYAHTQKKIHVHTLRYDVAEPSGARSGPGSREQSMVRQVREGGVRKINRGGSKGGKK